MLHLKNMTAEQLERAPQVVKNIYLMAYMKQQISEKAYTEATTKHPDYFTDETGREVNIDTQPPARQWFSQGDSLTKRIIGKN